MVKNTEIVLEIDSVHTKNNELVYSKKEKEFKEYSEYLINKICSVFKIPEAEIIQIKHDTRINKRECNRLSQYKV